jgi:probable H4MPT-linked C1 transfer pathway protein
MPVAAANWLALATFAGRFAPRGAALLIDVGSTTTDIIPLQDGVPTPQGRTDLERLACGELLYMGVQRTPVCAIVQSARWRGRDMPVAAEVFATTRDVYVLLGDLPEAADDRDTADGQPATRAAAHARLARMLCADADQIKRSETLALAQQVAAVQRRRIQQALRAMKGQAPANVILAGSGEFLAREAVSDMKGRRLHVISLTAKLGAEASRAACAFAVATLAAEGAVR